MLTVERLLIIEEEFLIALDIQEMLEGSLARQSTLARTYEEARSLADRFGTFDLAIVTPPRSPPDMAVADRLVAAGVAIVVSTASRIDLSGTSLRAARVVYKPFLADELLAACQLALADRAP